MVAQEINSIGWNDKLGELDNEIYSHGRYDNQRERIGKKYQWKALFAVEARLMDHFAVLDRWHHGSIGNTYILNPPFPWYGSTINDFDVTLPAENELIDDDDLADILDKQMPFIIDKSMTDRDWVEQPVTTAECKHFFVGENNKWILLSFSR